MHWWSLNKRIKTLNSEQFCSQERQRIWYLEEHIVLSNKMPCHRMEATSHETAQRQVQQRLDAQEVQDGHVKGHAEPNVDKVRSGYTSTRNCQYVL